jgi:hypothetical protein
MTLFSQDPAQLHKMRFRSMSEAFADERAYAIEDGKGKPMTFHVKQSKLREFWQVYKLYRRGAHSPAYCLRRAYTIVYRNWSF